MLNKCFKYACAHEKTAFLAKTNVFLDAFLVFWLLGVAPQGGSSSFLLLLGTICSFVNECALTLWQRTKSRQFLRVRYFYFFVSRLNFWHFWDSWGWSEWLLKLYMSKCSLLFGAKSGYYKLDTLCKYLFINMLSFCLVL